jgi:hypothetical protein
MVVPAKPRWEMTEVPVVALAAVSRWAGGGGDLEGWEGWRWWRMGVFGRQGGLVGRNPTWTGVQGDVSPKNNVRHQNAIGGTIERVGGDALKVANDAIPVPFVGSTDDRRLEVVCELPSGSFFDSIWLTRSRKTSPHGHYLHHWSRPTRRSLVHHRQGQWISRWHLSPT